MKNTVSLLNLIFVLVICSVAPTCFAKDYKIKWEMDVDYSTALENKKIKVGDNLVFKYESIAHTVNKVNEEEYKSCKRKNVYLEKESDGSSVFPLKTVGTHYFICTVPGHCERGMKLAVKAVESDEGGSKQPLPPPAEETPSPPSRDCGTPPPSEDTPPSPPNVNGGTVYSSSLIICPLPPLSMAALIAPLFLL